MPNSLRANDPAPVGHVTAKEGSVAVILKGEKREMGIMYLTSNIKRRNLAAWEVGLAAFSQPSGRIGGHA